MYDCNYCGKQHEDATHSVEHIVPELLLNKHFVLSNACRYWNNFFARSFENSVTSSPFLKGVLRTFDPQRVPQKGVVYLEEVTTARGTAEHLWLLDGKEMARDIPERQTTDRISIEAFDSTEQAYPIEIKLPFTYTLGIKGDDAAIKGAQRKIEKEKQRILEYISLLAKNPSTDSALAQELSQRGLTLRVPKSAEATAQVISTTPGETISDIQPKAYPLDREAWVKFYIKIGWCFACLKLGRQALISQGGEWILNYLKSGDIDSSAVAKCRSIDAELTDKIFRDVEIDGSKLWLWRSEISVTDDLIQAAPNALATIVAPLQHGRKKSESVAATWVNFPVVGALDDEARKSLDSRRFHSLRLHTETAKGRSALVCSIKLFGGILQATAQLTLPTAANAAAQTVATEHKISF